LFSSLSDISFEIINIEVSALLSIGLYGPHFIMSEQFYDKCIG